MRFSPRVIAPWSRGGSAMHLQQRAQTVASILSVIRLSGPRIRMRVSVTFLTPPLFAGLDCGAQHIGFGEIKP
jgi:hypothetical protein